VDEQWDDAAMTVDPIVVEWQRLRARLLAAVVSNDGEAVTAMQVEYDETRARWSAEGHDEVIALCDEWAAIRQRRADARLAYEGPPEQRAADPHVREVEDAYREFRDFWIAIDELTAEA
jgi:hypothetical protein